jgi:hypothetical protein
MKTIDLKVTFTIEKSYNIDLFGVDGSTPLTSLELGQLQKDFKVLSGRRKFNRQSAGILLP